MASNIIYNPKKLGRIVSFHGLPHVGPCSPADIDICVEVGDLKKYLIGDFKEEGRYLKKGQRLLIERHCDAFKAIGYKAVGFLAWHPEHDEVISAAEAVVVQRYCDGEWFEWDAFHRKTLLDLYKKVFGLGLAGTVCRSGVA